MNKGPVLDALVVGAGHSGRLVLAHLLAQGLAAEAVDWDDQEGEAVRGRTTAVGLDTDGADSILSIYVASAAKAADTIRARAVVAATGAIEAPREHARIAGDRPAGVVTPSLALSLLSRGLTPGYRPVVWLNGNRSAEAAARLEEAGAQVIRRGPAVGDCRVVRVDGQPRVREVTILSLDGSTETIPADALVFADGLIPMATFLKGRPALFQGEKPLAVDAGGRTTLPGLYATGTLVLPDPDHRLCTAHAQRVAETVVSDLSSLSPVRGWPVPHESATIHAGKGVLAFAPSLGPLPEPEVTLFAVIGQVHGDLVMSGSSGTQFLSSVDEFGVWSGVVNTALDPKRLDVKSSAHDNSPFIASAAEENGR